MTENERKHHANQIQRQILDKEKEQKTFEAKHHDLKEKFQNEKQRIGQC